MIILKAFLILSALFTFSSLIRPNILSFQGYFTAISGGGFHYSMFGPNISVKKYNVFITIDDKRYDWIQVIPHSLRENFLACLSMNPSYFDPQKVKEEMVLELMRNLKEAKAARKIVITVQKFGFPGETTVWERSL